MDIIFLLFKIIVKLRLNKIVFFCLSPFTKNTSKLPTSQEATSLLDKISRNPDNSCICNNVIDKYPEYDLQIIIPAYNVEEYIEECLLSVFNQDTKYKVLVVVINDGSTDKTLSIINKYKNRKDYIIINQNNQGLSGARNSGLAHINSKYIFFLDSDDILLPDSIEMLLNNAKRTAADIIAGGFQRFYKNKITSEVVLNNDDSANYHQITGFACGKIYKSELFQNIQFPNGYIFEDTLMHMIIYPQCKRIVSINSKIFGYRINQKGITLSIKSNSMNLDSFWITQKLLEDRKKIGIIEDQNEFCKTLLSQIKVNFDRIKSINKREVDKAVFVLSQKLLFDNIPSVESLKIKSPLLDTFLQNNYHKYRLVCLLNL